MAWGALRHGDEEEAPAALSAKRLCLLAIATHYAVCLPSASPSAGMMFANPNFKSSFAYNNGCITLLACAVFILTSGYLWVNLIF